jgi:hypothetical protein
LRTMLILDRLKHMSSGFLDRFNNKSELKSSFTFYFDVKLYT